MMRVQSWNKILLMTCVMALLVDPIFFYIPEIDGKRKCLVLDRSLKIITCVLRTFLDLFYIILHLILQFRAGYIAPDDPKSNAKRYSSSKFVIDILSIIPLPQVFVLVLPLLENGCFKYMILVQYVPRIVRICPFFREVTKTAGLLSDKAWAAAHAAYNLLLYMLASHVVGSVWYLLSVESEIRCWRQELKNANLFATTYMSCRHHNPNAFILLNSSCPLRNPDEIDDPSVFNFGIFIDALRSRVVELTTNFPQKIFYCLWWGLRNVSSLGQNLNTSTFIEEIFFTIFISIFGLILFALLIGNMQKYLQSMQSTAVRAEEMRVNRQNIEKWMSQRMLPENLRERIRRYEHYKWKKHEGVDEETLMRNLPEHLTKYIKRHLFLDLIKRVPFFGAMDDQLLDALCDKLKPVLYTEKSDIIHEGDPVDRMIFVMRGSLAKKTKHCGGTGFLNLQIKAGDFCGEEILTWALDPKSSSNLPISTRTVESISEVEALALMANDLKCVASQFRRLHNKHIQHAFRFYSMQWRTWAACFIQAAWRRYIRMKSKKSKASADHEQGSSSRRPNDEPDNRFQYLEIKVI